MVLYNKLSSVVVVSSIPLIHKISATRVVMCFFTNIPWGLVSNFYIINFSLKVLYLAIYSSIYVGYRIL